VTNLDTRREHYHIDAVNRREALDRKAVVELAARCRIEWERLDEERRQAKDHRSNANRARRTG
jgi:hypothetical protein